MGHYHSFQVWLDKIRSYSIWICYMGNETIVVSHLWRRSKLYRQGNTLDIALWYSWLLQVPGPVVWLRRQLLQQWGYKPVNTLLSKNKCNCSIVTGWDDCIPVYCCLHKCLQPQIIASILCDSHAISRSLLSTSMIDSLLAGFLQLFRPVLTRFEMRNACSKRRSLMNTMGGTTLECPFAKIRSQNFWRWTFHENWIPWK